MNSHNPDIRAQVLAHLVGQMDIGKLSTATGIDAAPLGSEVARMMRDGLVRETMRTGKPWLYERTTPC